MMKVKTIHGSHVLLAVPIGSGRCSDTWCWTSHMRKGTVSKKDVKRNKYKVINNVTTAIKIPVGN